MPIRRTDVAMLLVVLIWGINFAVLKGSFHQIPPLAFTALRFTIASVLLLPIALREDGSGPLSRAVLLRLGVIGVLGNTLYQLGFMLGLARTTATNSAMLLAIMPVTVAVMATALGFERRRASVFWGIGVASVGVVTVISVRGVEFSSATLLGDLLTVSAALCWAAYTIALRTLPSGLTPLRVTAIATITGTPGLLLAGTPELLALDWAAVHWDGWVAVGYATLLSLVLAYILWNRSVQVVGPSRTAIYSCLTPVVASTAAWLLLGERPHPLQGVGAALIIGGVFLARR